VVYFCECQNDMCLIFIMIKDMHLLFSSKIHAPAYLWWYEQNLLMHICLRVRKITLKNEIFLSFSFLFVSISLSDHLWSFSDELTGVANTIGIINLSKYEKWCMGAYFSHVSANKVVQFCIFQSLIYFITSKSLLSSLLIIESHSFP